MIFAYRIWLQNYDNQQNSKIPIFRARELMAIKYCRCQPTEEKPHKNSTQLAGWKDDFRLVLLTIVAAKHNFLFIYSNYINKEKNSQDSMLLVR
jgi:hypothetical protein